jgi:hypothetical protein
MKSQIINYVKILCFLLLLNACSAPEVQNDPVVGGDSNITITNKSFDFSTYRQVKLLSTTVKIY